MLVLVFEWSVKVLSEMKSKQRKGIHQYKGGKD